MADFTDHAGSVFLRNHARILLRGRYILMIGDSVQRGAYKDLVALLEDGTLMTDKEKIAKCEPSFRGDRLIDCTEASNGTNFSEVREYTGCSKTPSTGDCWRDSILIRYVFTTRVYNEYIEEIFRAVTNDYYPDIICVNSTFWDITRYGDKEEGADGIIKFPEFEKNIEKLLKMINKKSARAFQCSTDYKRQDRPKIPTPCLRIWRSALPIGRNARGGLLIEEINFGDDAEVYRMDMGQANLNIQSIIKKHNWDLLDAQFWFRKVQHLGYREKDGVHWNQIAHRWLTNIFLSHICTAYGVKPPSASASTDERTFRDFKTELTEVFEQQFRRQ